MPASCRRNVAYCTERPSSRSIPTQAHHLAILGEVRARSTQTGVATPFTVRVPSESCSTSGERSDSVDDRGEWVGLEGRVVFELQVKSEVSLGYDVGRMGYGTDETDGNGRNGTDGIWGRLDGTQHLYPFSKLNLGNSALAIRSDVE